MNWVKDRRYWLSLVLALSGLLATTGAIDDIGAQHTENALVRALATFGIARALNGVISVAQGTEIAIEPAGIGVIFTPGQILDPVNDLIERFSWVMLVSSASLGVLNILLTMSIWQWFNVVLLVLLSSALVTIWLKPLQGILIHKILFRLSLALIILRFAAPLIAIGNEFVYQQFLQPRYQTAITELEQTTGRIESINEQLRQKKDANSAQEKNILDKARELYQSAVQSIDVRAQINKYEQAASDASRYAIDLIVIFVFQTILMPIVFLWLAWHALKWAFRYNTMPTTNSTEN